jgi:predicted nucleic acid-binding protein
MVFVYHFLSSLRNQHLTSKANRFLKDIENGKYIGIVTTFTIAEYLAVMKGILCEKRNKQLSTEEATIIKSKFEQFINQMGIMLYDSDSLASKKQIFSECESVIERSIAFKGRQDRKWHYIKGADALHVALAISVNAEAIATFDDDFRGINGSISPLMLYEVY